MLDPRYLRDYFDTKKSIQPMEDALSTKERNEIKQRDELTKPVPGGWDEESAGEETEWEPPRTHSYLGAQGGPKHGPTQATRDAAMAPGAKIMDIFLLILPEELLQMMVVENTNNYATQDLVHPVGAKDQDGKERKKKWLVPCGRNDDDGIAGPSEYPQALKTTASS
jgi:hypothetical protein